MVLKRPCISDTGECSALHIHCSGLPGDRALSCFLGRQCFETFSWKTELQVAAINLVGRWALKGHFFTDTGKDSFIVQVSQEKRSCTPYIVYSQHFHLKGGLCLAHPSFRSCVTQRSQVWVAWSYKDLFLIISTLRWCHSPKRTDFG